MALTPMREFFVLPMVVRVVRLKMRVNWAFSKGRVSEAKAGCWMLGQGPLNAGARVIVKLDRAHAISPRTIL